MLFQICLYLVVYPKNVTEIECCVLHFIPPVPFFRMPRKTARYAWTLCHTCEPQYFVPLSTPELKVGLMRTHLGALLNTCDRVRRHCIRYACVHTILTGLQCKQNHMSKEASCTCKTISCTVSCTWIMKYASGILGDLGVWGGNILNKVAFPLKQKQLYVL
jgi:hypothetical protein